MTEEINYSYDGGIYGELVRDRTPSRAWDALSSLAHGGARRLASCNVSVDETDRAQRRAHAQPPRHRDRGHRSLARRSGERRLLGHSRAPAHRVHRLVLRQDRQRRAFPSLSALQNDQTGAVAATATVTGLTGEWKQYTYTLKTGDVPVSSNNHLILTIAQAGDGLVRSGLALSAHLSRRGPAAIAPTSWRSWPPCIPSSCACPAATILKAITSPSASTGRRPSAPGSTGRRITSPWQLSLVRRHGPARVPGVVRGPEDASPCWRSMPATRWQQEHVDPGPALEPYVQDALDEIEYVTGGAGHQVGRRAHQGRPPRAVPAALRRGRQRGRVRPLRLLRRPLRAVLSTPSSSAIRTCRSSPPRR